MLREIKGKIGPIVDARKSPSPPQQEQTKRNATKESPAGSKKQHSRCAIEDSAILLKPDGSNCG